MAQGRGESAWGRTSNLMALIANVNRDPKKGRPFKPEDFNPYARKSRVIVLTKKNFGLLRDLFIGKAGN
ncbi:MAG TPA: hypothetical protein PKY88_12870 [Anaerohalosphaeraceae bacterium]|nr:hypothetical protein [Anaerohalosphaeraceae bacterium]